MFKQQVCQIVVLALPAMCERGGAMSRAETIVAHGNEPDTHGGLRVAVFVPFVHEGDASPAGGGGFPSALPRRSTFCSGKNFSRRHAGGARGPRGRWRRGR